MDNVLRLPSAVRRFPRLAFDSTAPEASAADRQYRNELQAARNYLCAALLHLDKEMAGDLPQQTGIRRAVPDAEAALFHILTLDGCSENKRLLRKMLTESDADRGAN
ncbi:MAG: hypothetical protein EON58_03930 [Alphaproteobacteria bacterium]|nr:MAG: hypothetical protein EON58_03930 [Alphaproteobacteria bacterium]